MTFGSLHNPFKLNVGVFDLWSRLLKAVPTARLLMFHDFVVGTAQDRIRRLFAERGIASERLDLRQGSCAPGYLGIHDHVDISLDPFPCTGGVTTCESLWMGVPVVSLRGVPPCRPELGGHPCSGWPQRLGRPNARGMHLACRAPSE